ncbi:WhiB family transcriptional regulator [Streptomyces griseorubiginosus]|uniref:WhiB family transcriptional regulator n=1 Tax=Streptomyces griseorubiginosus TaxID=67304 RepID=UPI0036BAFD6A
MTSPGRATVARAAEASENWQVSAACGGSNGRAFATATPTVAKEICGGCPVRLECLYDALDSKASNGIWGGLTYHERRALPVLPSGRGAALNVLRQHLDTPAAPAKTSEPMKSKTPTPREKAGRLSNERKPRKRAARKTEPVPAVPREDVAELLRQRVAQRQIMKDLKVSHQVVVATREAYGIPRRGGSGHRYSPERRAENERRTIEMLKAGATYQQISDEVGISQPTIFAIRVKVGLPAPDNRGGQPARSKAEALALNTEPYGDGHARWTGTIAGRSFQLNAEGQQLNARRVAFEQHHGRPPEGRVSTDCGVTSCIAGAHLTDDTLRAARPKEEPPVTVQALKNLLDEIDEQGGPQAARENRLHLTPPTAPRDEEPALMPTTTDAEPMPVGQGLTAAQANAETLPVGVLLKWGDDHPDADVRDQAARGRAILTGLRQRHAADAELTAVNTELERLEKRLAELHARQAELAPKKKPAYRPAEVRAWAKANGVTCPGNGRVPKTVVEAWLKATRPTSGATP